MDDCQSDDGELGSSGFDNFRPNNANGRQRQETAQEYACVGEDICIVDIPSVRGENSQTLKERGSW